MPQEFLFWVFEREAGGERGVVSNKQRATGGVAEQKEHEKRGKRQEARQTFIFWQFLLSHDEPSLQLDACCSKAKCMEMFLSLSRFCSSVSCVGAPPVTSTGRSTWA